MSTMHTPLPASVFKHLEPYPGGSWTVSAETADTVTASYSYGDNPEVVSYTLHRCQTEQDVMAQCQSLMYNFESEDEELAAENSSDARATITEPAASTIELKIEQVDNAAWTSLAMPTTENCFGFHPDQANTVFSAPIQSSYAVQQSTPEYTFCAPASVDCQQQIPFTYNGSFVPINNYWPIQAEFQDINGEFATSGEYCALGEHQWIQ